MPSDGLPRDDSGRDRRDPTDDVAFFRGRFDDALDLADLTPAARRVLAVAAALFLRRGAAATSVRDITAACGLSPAALYNHFASKDDLLAAVVDHGHVQIEAKIASALATAEPAPMPRLTAFVRAYVRAHLDNPRLAQVVRREYLHLSEERRAAVVGRRRRVRNDLTALVRAAHESGPTSLPHGTDPERIAVMILDMGARTSDWYHPRHAESPAHLADQYVAAALRLVGIAEPVTAG